MRKLILEEWVSLDGYISDKNGNLDFFNSLTSGYSDQDQLQLGKVNIILSCPKRQRKVYLQQRKCRQPS